jgi:hypothetical protein
LGKFSENGARSSLPWVFPAPTIAGYTLAHLAGHSDFAMTK